MEKGGITVKRPKGNEDAKQDAQPDSDSLAFSVVVAESWKEQRFSSYWSS